MIYTTNVIQEENKENGIEQITEINVDFSDEGVTFKDPLKSLASGNNILRLLNRICETTISHYSRYQNPNLKTRR